MGRAAVRSLVSNNPSSYPIEGMMDLGSLRETLVITDPGQSSYREDIGLGATADFVEVR